MREGIKRNESESTHVMISFLEYNDESCALTRKKNIEKKKKKKEKEKKKRLPVVVCWYACVCVCVFLCVALCIYQARQKKKQMSK